ncbi:hypothetical protein E4T42_05422 [Aureobasidium subglaciale]|nr:hypothetical protein E4T42_05422 [Aureobasidium subglaciale]
MDDDYFYHSLRELRLQLNSMNIRTAAFLNKHSTQDTVNMQHHTLNLPHVLPPSVQLNNMQCFQDLSAKIDTLTTQHHQHFETLHDQLNALSDKVDHMTLDTPRYTPPESSTSSVLGDPTLSTPCPVAPPMPTQAVSKPSATIADVGGYFLPNRKYDQQSDDQCILHASVFVARVNRALRTKSIANIEAFLKGSALRWFNAGLCLDGSHDFDNHIGDLNLAKFCESLMLVFGAPESASADHDDQPRIFGPSSRNNLLDGYILPALESRRLKTTHGQTDVGVGEALRQAVQCFNKDHKALSVDPNIIGNEDLSVEVARLRHKDIENRREHNSLRMRQLPQVSKPIKIQLDDPYKSSPSHAKTQERPVFPPGTTPEEPQNTDNKKFSFKKLSFNRVSGKPTTLPHHNAPAIGLDVRNDLTPVTPWQMSTMFAPDPLPRSPPGAAQSASIMNGSQGDFSKVDNHTYHGHPPCVSYSGQGPISPAKSTNRDCTTPTTASLYKVPAVRHRAIDASSEDDSSLYKVSAVRARVIDASTEDDFSEGDETSFVSFTPGLGRKPTLSIPEPPKTDRTDGTFWAREAAAAKAENEGVTPERNHHNPYFGDLYGTMLWHKANAEGMTMDEAEKESIAVQQRQQQLMQKRQQQANQEARTKLLAALHPGHPAREAY